MLINQYQKEFNTDNTDLKSSCGVINVIIEGNVSGDIDCGGSVKINGEHKGSIDAGGSVSIR